RVLRLHALFSSCGDRRDLHSFPTRRSSDLPEAREHEHLVALDGGPDGLDVHRRVIAGAPERLTRSGTLLVETSAAQATAAAALMADAGLLTRVVRDEAIGATAVVGRAHG